MIIPARISEIPGNSRREFWGSRFPGIPGNSRTGIPGGLGRHRQLPPRVTPTVVTPLIGVTKIFCLEMHFFLKKVDDLFLVLTLKRGSKTTK